MSSENRLRCSIQTLLNWKKLSTDVSESIYLVAEKLNTESSLSGYPLEKSIIHKRLKNRQAHYRSSLERTQTIYKFFEMLSNQKLKKLFDEIILNNNLPLLHRLKKHPKLMGSFVLYLENIHQILKAHNETLAEFS